MTRRTEPERTLSERELNRALLVRQQLLQRSGPTVPKVIERVAGLQTQYSPAGYVGLRTRLEGSAEMTSRVRSNAAAWCRRG